MRLLRLFALCSLLATCAFASGVNMKLSGNQDPPCGPPFLCISGDSFTFGVNGAGGGFIDAVNGRTTNITTLGFDLDYLDAACPGGSPSPVSLILDSSFLQFASTSLAVTSSSKCTASQGIAEYVLNLNFTAGVPVGERFQIDLNANSNSQDPNGAGGFVPNEVSIVNVSDVPEPGALGLFAGAIGLAACGIARRFRGRSQN